MIDKRKLLGEDIYLNLPKDLGHLTEIFQGRERDIVLLSSIGVLSNCLPNIYGVYDGDNIYPQLYVIIIAPPASGKGVMNYSRLLIDKIHDKITQNSKKARSDCQKKNTENKEQKTCPEIAIKILPANISTSEMYSYLGSSQYGLLIMESEADTMSNMLKNDWSNYSDVLRKAFHHESVSISRKKERIFDDIKEPKLAMVISGTPDQLQPLIQAKENGLFSRFIIYNFDEISEFKDVFAKKNRNYKKVFQNFGNEIFELYGKLIKLEKPIEFIFTEEQKKKFLGEIKRIRTDIIENHSRGFIPNLHRHAVILFRIAMILSAIRNRDKLSELSSILECSNEDFSTSLTLMKTLLRHSQYTYDSMDIRKLTLQDRKLLDDLRDNFTTQEAYSVGKKYNIVKRTIDDKLQQWLTKKTIKRISKGKYIKL